MTQNDLILLSVQKYRLLLLQLNYSCRYDIFSKHLPPRVHFKLGTIGMKPFHFYRKITERADTIQDYLVDFRWILSEL